MPNSQGVYFFGDGRADGDGAMKELLGGKGAGLAEMTKLGLPVPPGFTITTAECIRFYNEGRKLRDALRDEARAAIRQLEAILERGFGDPSRPLLVSVRSGARVSMPGMMDTVLNLGLNDSTVRGLIAQTENPRFGWDSYRRFIQMFGDVVLGVPHEEFEAILESTKRERGAQLDTQLTAEDLEGVAQRYKSCVREHTGREFPDDPEEQLWTSVTAVFGSWYNDRAYSYRRLNRIPHDWGTAANVQAMVFGNMGEDSATGVAFTRDPSTGENHFYGEYLTNAQGEDVVAGIRTPHPLTRVQVDESGQETLEDIMPEAFAQLNGYRENLEQHYKDMQDLEFTIERGRLWMLQTRSGKRTGAAALRIAADMQRQGLVSEREALLLVDPDVHLDQLLHPMIDPSAKLEPLASGLNASPGAASGTIVFTADRAVAESEAGHSVVLVRTETSPEDIEGMSAARAILTARGGRTSHAAVVARGMGKVCVAGCSALTVDANAKTATFTMPENESRVFGEGDVLTIDGSAGFVYEGDVPTVEPELSGDYELLMGWADEQRRLRVRTNADTPPDAAAARRFGAEGIGLCRTEHMFFGEERLPWVRKMILATTREERVEALAHLKPMQRQDFEGIFEAMDGLPVTIRLLDPPLHEFVPHDRPDADALAHELGMSADEVWRRVGALREMNPMLGHRGARLGVTFPEVYEMQVEAILEAAHALVQRGMNPHPEIMLPLIGVTEEYSRLDALVRRVAARTLGDDAERVAFSVGTMIEVPRATLIADRIAVEAEFFSFGTNDLTQLVYGYSRDDAGVFLPHYVAQGILAHDPFQSLDQQGVGAMVRLGTEKGRETKPDLKVGICGEHGGDPSSIGFFNGIGLDYVSCSPYRVPIARLAAAQAAVRQT